MHAGDFADVGQDAFELAAVDDLQAGLDAGIEVVGTAFEVADVAAAINERDQRIAALEDEIKRLRAGTGGARAT